MRSRSLLCSLVLLTVVAGDVEYFQIGQAHAEFIANRPFNGKRRNIELNIRGAVYYGYGWYGCDYYYTFNDCYYGGTALGPGFQMLFPLVQNGFIPSINNAFYLGFFTDFIFVPTYYNSYGDGFFSLAIGPMAQWRFYLFDIFSVFTNFGFGLWPWFVGNSFICGPRGAYCGTQFHWFPLIEFGGNVHFTPNFAMTFSFGYPSVKLGLSIGF